MRQERHTVERERVADRSSRRYLENAQQFKKNSLNPYESPMKTH